MTKRQLSSDKEKRREKRKKKRAKQKMRRGEKIVETFRVFFPGFREEMLTRAVSRRPSKHYAGYRARGTRGMAQSARGPSISRVASRGTSRRKKFNYNLRLMGVEEGREKIGGDRSRSFVRPPLSPCQEVEG